MKKRVVIYARFSSHSQTEQSIEGQLRECYEYAKRQDLLVVAEYIDRALTGTTDKRPEFLRMIDDSKKKTFNSFINRVILYDDKILIFYNTDDNHPTVIKRKDTEEFISQLNDIASNSKTATNDCQNATGNDSPIVQKENSPEPQGFKRVSLGGALVT